jgi:predicted metal-dependent hydrolase
VELDFEIMPWDLGMFLRVAERIWEPAEDMDPQPERFGSQSQSRRLGSLMGGTYTCDVHRRYLIISQIHSQKMDNIKLGEATNQRLESQVVSYLEPITVYYLSRCTKTEQARAVHTTHGSQSVPRVEDRLATSLVDAIAQMHLSHHASGVPAGTLPARLGSLRCCSGSRLA